MTSKQSCTFPGCDRPYSGRGYCPGHLAQQKAGRVLAPLKQYISGPRVCEFDSCGRAVDAKNLCSGHYQQLKVKGVLTPIAAKQELCSVPDCGLPYYSLGYCHKHYKRIRATGDVNSGWRASKIIDDPKNDHLLVEIKGRRGAGLWALVDREDRAFVENKSFSLATGGYAKRGLGINEGERANVELHRDIMGSPEGKQVDHINGNRLDNRRKNLRIVTFAEQMQNKKPWSESGHRNVHKTSDGRYRVVVRANDKLHYGGTFGIDQLDMAVRSAKELRAKVLTHHNEDRTTKE